MRVLLSVFFVGESEGVGRALVDLNCEIEREAVGSRVVDWADFDLVVAVVGKHMLLDTPGKKHRHTE